MDVHTGISLKNYTTMKLGGSARFMTSATTPDDVLDIYNHAKQHDLPIFVLGGGSNILVRDEGFNGIVVLNRIKGFEVIEDTASSVVVKVGSGEIWDEIVEKTVEMGLSGIEALSAIPGTAGAAPVQNIGAYGQEVADVLVSLEAYDRQIDQIVTLDALQCNFAYRNSIFRDKEINRYCIVSITMKLYRQSPQPPFYAALQKYLDDNNISIYTVQIIRDAVMAIRSDKLPDPAERPNTGSFFKNAVIENWQYEDLIKRFPGMPNYDMPGNTHKIPTGWLIEQAGLKGELLHGIRVHDKNALVLVNESAESYSDLAQAREEIIQRVYDMFHIQISQEPLEMVL